MSKAKKTKGFSIGRKKARTFMKRLGLKAIYPGPKTSDPISGHKIYPYLLKNKKIKRNNQVWSTDITYIRLKHGFVYLTAIIDWYSRYVISWRLSNTLDQRFCIEALNEAIETGKPEVFNTDQGSQFTSDAFTGILEKEDIKISMDGKGSATDNARSERLWRSVKYEDIFLNGYDKIKELKKGLDYYFKFYNLERLHQALGYQTPEQVYLN